MTTMNKIEIPPVGTIMQGKKLDDFLLSGIEANKQELISHLSEFDGQDLFPRWLELIRCLDELINLRYALLPEEWFLIRGINVDVFCHKDEFLILLNVIEGKYGTNVSKRLSRLILMIASMKMTYQFQKLPGMDFQDVNGVIDFFQARRLYYVTYLTFIRLYAKGEKKAPFMELLCHFQYQIDFNMCSITSALHSMIGNHCIEGYHAIVKSDRLEYSFPYSQLDEFFLEPQMMNELDILNYETQIVGFNNTSVPRLLYSYKELENAVSTVEEVFSKYDVKECVELLEAK